MHHKNYHTYTTPKDRGMWENPEEDDKISFKISENENGFVIPNP